MKTSKISTRAFAALMLGASAIIAVACGGNSDTNPTPTGTGGGGSTGASPITSTTTTMGTTSTTSGTTSTTSTTSGGGGCFMGTPMNNTDYLNQCNGMTCQAFDNSKAKLPLINSDGSLPPLPM